MESLQEVTNALSNGTIPDPLRPPLPLDWGYATPKTAIAIISGTGKATNFNFGRYSYEVHQNKSPLKIWEKREHGRIQGLPKLFEYPLLSQERVKLRTSNFVRMFLVSIRIKPITNFRKSSGGLVRTLDIFRGTHILGRAHRAVIFAIAQLSCL